LYSLKHQDTLYNIFSVLSGKAAVFSGTAARINLTFIKACVTFHMQMNNSGTHINALNIWGQNTVKWSEVDGFREMKEESRRHLCGLSFWRRQWWSCVDHMPVENWRCCSYELLQSFRLLHVSGVGTHVELASLVTWDLRFWGWVC